MDQVYTNTVNISQGQESKQMQNFKLVNYKEDSLYLYKLLLIEYGPYGYKQEVKIIYSPFGNCQISTIPNVHSIVHSNIDINLLFRLCYRIYNKPIVINPTVKLYKEYLSNLENVVKEIPFTNLNGTEMLFVFYETDLPATSLEMEKFDPENLLKFRL